MSKKLKLPKKEVLADDSAIDAAKAVYQRECPNCFISTTLYPSTVHESKLFTSKEYVHYRCSECQTRWRVLVGKKINLLPFVGFLIVGIFILSLFLVSPTPGYIDVFWFIVAIISFIAFFPWLFAFLDNL